MTYNFEKLCVQVINARKNRTLSVTLEASKNTATFVQLLYEHGYVSSFRIVGFKLHLKLSSFKGEVALKKLQVTSKKRRFLFVKVPSVLKSGNQVKEAIFFTSRRLITQRDAIRFRVGGGSLCKLLL